MDDEGLTLVEVLLSLFILSIGTIVFSAGYYTIHRLIIVDTENQQMGELAKSKVEELKSNRIYIDHVEHPIISLLDETIHFQEDEYTVEVSIKPLHNNPKMHHVNVKVTSELSNAFYNLIRYMDFSKDTFPNIYEELPIDSDQLSD